MLGNLRGVSPLSETMSEGTLERNRAEKALITKTPTQSQVFSKKDNVKNYSDKNGNDVSKSVGKGRSRKTFAFWTLVCLLFVLAIGNLVLTFTILAVLRLGQGMESMEFLPEVGALKLRGAAWLQHVYKRDGRIESFRDEPLALRSDDGAVVFNLQTRSSRSDARLVVNASGVFVLGVAALELRDTSSHSHSHSPLVFSSAAPSLSLRAPLRNLHAKRVRARRVAAGAGAALALRGERAARLGGAEGARLDAREIHWTADQDVLLRSVNGSVVLSGKDGVYIDVRYLPIALPDEQRPAPQFKLCVCMPQGKLFRVSAPAGQRAACSHINVTGDLNPCI